MGKKVIKQKHKKTKNKNIIKIIIFILIIAIAVISIKSLKKDDSTNELSLIIDNQEVTSDLEKEIIKKDNIIYISFEDTKKFLDDTLYQENELIITSSEKKIATLELGKSEITINGSNISINGQAFKNEDDTIYLPISEMENVYDIEFDYIEDTNTAMIDYYSKELKKAYTKKKVSIKSEKSKFSDTLEKVKKGNWLIYISEEDGWSKVRTQNGKIGYVKSKSLTNFVTERENMTETEESKNIEQYLEKDITKENISTYEKRIKLINKILLDAVNKDYKGAKILYKDEEQKGLERLKIEIKPILKECGINVIFEVK